MNAAPAMRRRRSRSPPQPNEKEDQYANDHEERDPRPNGIRGLNSAIRAVAGKLNATVLINGMRYLPARATRSILEPVHARLPLGRPRGSMQKPFNDAPFCVFVE